MYTKWNHKVILLLVAIVAFSTLAATAQQKIWSVNTDNRMTIITDKAVERQSFPVDFKLFDLNIDPIRQQLFSVVDHRGGSTVIQLPNADGNIEFYEVYEDSNFEPDLQAQFPEIRAYSGRGITDRYATLKLSISPQGIQTMVFRTDNDNEFMEPYSSDHNTYAVYKAHRDRGDLPWACDTNDRDSLSDLHSQLKSRNLVPESTAGEVKTLRLAQSCNGEYANFFNAHSATDVALVLAAFNATHTRVNGVLEKDLAVHFNLIAGTTAVIYYDPATDPYTTLSSWNAQEQAVMTANVGAANYDIGHMFGASGGGGNAGCIGCVCVDSTKGSGITSPADAIPQGDNFDIDYVVHEMGHQLGGNHSFTFQNEGTGVQMEVGSGITIMGYAGITSQDVAPHSIDTFHAGNIAQIQANLATKTCPVTTTMTANHAPVVAPVSAATIPISTPFSLTSSATDAEGDPLTYQWEEIDNSNTLTGSSSVASATKASGPNWLSFAPTTSPTRMFPRLATVQSGLLVTPTLPGGDAIANTEALSSVSRTLNFRLTVRDNNPYVAGVKTGQTQSTDVAITVTSTAGPFKVTSPNTAVNWPGNTAQTVTWDVANTNTGTVNVANVKISYSSDGGVTFPTVLKASTPNDGSEPIVVPAVATSNARIKVEAVGNIFFDMSDANFTTTNAPVKSRADFDGDGKTDFSVFRPSSGTWYLQRSTAGFAGLNFGVSGDIPIPGDYDNDGKVDVAVYRGAANSTYYVLRSTNSTVGITAFGSNTTGDIPLAGDYDGDGVADLAYYRPTNSSWNVIKSTGGNVSTVFGQAGDKPVTGDFDGDNTTDFAVFRNGTWLVLPSSSPVNPVITNWGLATDIAVPGDFDGDGKEDLAVFRASNGTWYILKSSGGSTITAFGASGDVPVVGDYDGDGKDDIAVYRNGIWYVNQSTAGVAIFNFGLGSDIAVPNKYQPQ
jgi:hypothetical protein